METWLLLLLRSRLSVPWAINLVAVGAFVGGTEQGRSVEEEISVVEVLSVSEAEGGGSRSFSVNAGAVSE